MTARDIQLLSVSIVILLFCSFAGEAHILNGTPPNWYLKTYFPKAYVPPSPSNDTPPDGELVTRTVLSSDGHTNEGSTSDVLFIIDQDGVQEIMVTLSWQDDLGEPDTLGLSLSFEGSKLDAQEGSSGPLELKYVTDNATDPRGEYTVSVSALDCPGVVSIFPIDRDSGNDWSLTVKMTILE
jgi:hypothetical protein